VRGKSDAGAVSAKAAAPLARAAAARKEEMRWDGMAWPFWFVVAYCMGSPKRQHNELHARIAE
jgi:hypothetical protein